MPSGIFGSMIPSIQRKHLTLIGWNDWFGTNYYTLHGPKPYPLDGHPDAEDIREAEAWGQEIAERAIKIQAGDKSLIPSIRKEERRSYLPTFWTDDVFPWFRESSSKHQQVQMRLSQMHNVR